jgi:hypothetical protein
MGDRTLLDQLNHAQTNFSGDKRALTKGLPQVLG